MLGYEGSTPAGKISQNSPGALEDGRGVGLALCLGVQGADDSATKGNLSANERKPQMESDQLLHRVQALKIQAQNLNCWASTSQNLFTASSVPFLLL